MNLDNFEAPVSSLFSTKWLLSFDTFDIKSIPGFSVKGFIRASADSLHFQTEKEEYSFLIPTAAARDNGMFNLSFLKSKFTMETDCHSFQFELSLLPINDIMNPGFSKFRANFLNREEI